MFYLLFYSEEIQNKILSYLKQIGIHAVFHYIPLHNSPAGLKYGRTATNMETTEKVSQCLVRLPLWIGMDESDINQVINGVYDGLKQSSIKNV